MKKITFALVLALPILILLNCSKEPKIEVPEGSFIGTINGKEFITSEYRISYTFSKDFLDRCDFGQNCQFGSEESTRISIKFDYIEDTKPSRELLLGLNGPELLDCMSYKECSIIKIRLDFEGEKYSFPNVGDDNNDIFEIDEIITTGRYGNLRTNEAVAGQFFTLKGRIKIVEEDIIIEGDYILDLVELI